MRGDGIGRLKDVLTIIERSAGFPLGFRWVTSGVSSGF